MAGDPPFGAQNSWYFPQPYPVWQQSTYTPTPKQRFRVEMEEVGKKIAAEAETHEEAIGLLKKLRAAL